MAQRVLDLIHENTPKEMIPSLKRMEKFLFECIGNFGSEECIYWGKSQDKYVTISVLDQQITSKKDVNMYFFLNKKLRNVKYITFCWCYGFVPEGCKLTNTCKNKTCINPGHLSFQKFAATELSRSGIKFNTGKNERIVNAMKEIHPGTPSIYIPDYFSFTKFLSNCSGDWEGKDECVYWEGSSKRFTMNGTRLSPKRISYTWKFGEILENTKKALRICGNSKCINMHHFKHGAYAKKKRKIENS